MKILIICFSMITSSFLYSQSCIVTDIGTNIDIGSGSDICADIITINGTLTGSGTFCNNPVNVEIDTTFVPNILKLSQNYPNPFNPVTIIHYSIPQNVKGKTSKVILKVYDVLGNEVATLVDEYKPAGSYEIEFGNKNLDLSTGIYFYRLQVGSFIQCKKMILIK